MATAITIQDVLNASIWVVPVPDPTTYMRLARDEMAVVEPVDVPMFPPPDQAENLMAHDASGQMEAEDDGAAQIAHSMMDEQPPTQPEEVMTTAEFCTVAIEWKALIPPVI